VERKSKERGEDSMVLRGKSTTRKDEGRVGREPKRHSRERSKEDIQDAKRSVVEYCAEIFRTSKLL